MIELSQNYYVNDNLLQLYLIYLELLHYQLNQKN